MTKENDEINRNYENIERQEGSHDITVKTYKVDGQPTCLSWEGSKDHPAEACPFLTTGQYCFLVSRDVFRHEETQFLKPHKDCPLHSSDKGNDEL